RPAPLPTRTSSVTLRTPAPPPTPPLFPYTTLFRSDGVHRQQRTGTLAHRVQVMDVTRRAAPRQFQQRVASPAPPGLRPRLAPVQDRKSTRLNSSHVKISYAVFCLKKKKKKNTTTNA